MLHYKLSCALKTPFLQTTNFNGFNRSNSPSKVEDRAGGHERREKPAHNAALSGGGSPNADRPVEEGDRFVSSF